MRISYAASPVRAMLVIGWNRRIVVVILPELLVVIMNPAENRVMIGKMVIYASAPVVVGVGPVQAGTIVLTLQGGNAPEVR